VEDVLVDGVSVSAVTNYTFSNVTENHTISASFEIKPPPSSNEIVIDNDDAGTSFTGRWRVSSCPNPYGKNSLYSSDSNVHYTYQTRVNGTYRVMLWWTEHRYWRRSSVPVEIYDDDTLLDTLYVNQKTNGGKWNLLGRYAFHGTARVVVVAKGNGTTGVDALRFSK
jgi:hypothetical protein